MDEIKLITARELQKKEIPPLKWIINDILPEGLTVLAGSQKHGKSLLAMNMAMAIASANHFMGKFENLSGKVLYLPFEDGETRVQKRINEISKGYSLEFAPEDLIIPDSCYFPELNAGSFNYLNRIIKEKDIQLVVIDPLGAAISDANISQNYNYFKDYQMMKKFQQLANKTRISIVLIHHTRKMPSQQIFDKILGTKAITGASDVNMVLEKTPMESYLHIQGRDIEDKIYRLNLSKENFTYSLNGEGEPDRNSPERKAIIKVFNNSFDKEMKVEEIIRQSGMKNDNVRQLVKSMRDAGQLIDGSSRGFYKLPSPN